MRQYFIPPNETTRLMDERRKLRQGEGSLSTYVDKYRQLMLQLPHFHEVTKIHGFLFVLRSKIRMEIEKQQSMNLEMVVQLAERIGDFEELQQPFRAMKSSTHFPMRRNFSGQGQRVFHRSPTISKDNWGDSSGARKIMASTSNGERTPNLRRGCFEHGGPHLASECPRRKSTKVVVAQANVRNLEEGLDNNYEPLDILDEVDDGVMEVMARAARVKLLCFVVGVSHIDNLYLAVRINVHACKLQCHYW